MSVPGRPIGVCSPATSSSGSADPVAIQPGLTEFTVMPCRATSMAAARVSPSSPDLPALYPALSTLVTMGPVTDETLTTLP